MLASPSILAAALVSVAQLATNGLFFAGPPYEFSRPIYPEASGLMAGSVLNRDGESGILPMDAVSYSLSRNAAYNGKLKFNQKAFVDTQIRHENLLWLAEVGGERFALWDTALHRYSPVDWIDAELAEDYAAYVSYTPPPMDVAGSSYVRTPAYFCSHSSMKTLIDICNVSSNFYLKINPADFGVEYDGEYVRELHGTVLDMLVASNLLEHVSWERFKIPGMGSPFSCRPYTVAAMNLSELPSEVTAIFPVEFMSAPTNALDGKLLRYFVESMSKTCDPSPSWKSTVSNDGTWEPPTDAWQWSKTLTGDTDHPNQTLCVWTTMTPPAESSMTNDVVDTGYTGPITYRDLRCSYSSVEERESVWAKTQYRSPFCALYTEGSGTAIINSNKEESVTIDDIDVGSVNKVDVDVFAPSVLTRCSKEVSALCLVDVPLLGLYYRTNTYSVGMGRARNTDDGIILEDGYDADAIRKGVVSPVSFVDLLVDVAYSYSVTYAGWKDWKANGTQDQATMSGYDKRSLLPIRIYTVFPSNSVPETGIIEDRFTFKLDDLLSAVRKAVDEAVCPPPRRMNFEDEDLAYSSPPFFPATTSGPMVRSYSARRDAYFSIGISNLYVAANLNFSQGVESPPKYAVPGYRHLPPPYGSFPPEGQDWIYAGRDLEDVVPQLTVLSQALFDSQTTVPDETKLDVIRYSNRQAEAQQKGVEAIPLAPIDNLPVHSP